MENTEQNGHNNSRLDRLEKLMDLLITDHLAFSDEHKRLLAAQVVLTGTMRELAESQKHTDERLGVLIHMMDEFVRRRGETQ